MSPAGFANHLVDVHGLAIAGYEQPGMVHRTTGRVLSLLMMTDLVKKPLSKGMKDKTHDGIPQTEEELEELSRTELVAPADRFDVSPYRERWRKKSRAQLIAGIAEAMQDGVIPKPSVNFVKEKEDARERAFKAVEGMSVTKLRKLPKYELDGYAVALGVPLSYLKGDFQKDHKKRPLASVIFLRGQERVANRPHFGSTPAAASRSAS